MSMQDSISDMLTRIRNAQRANKFSVDLPSSKVKVAISKVLKNEGYIQDYKILNSLKPILNITLKYFKGLPVIEDIKRVSRPSLRVYKNVKNIPKVISGLGISILSTSKGIMTDATARKLNIGGEIICNIS
ncbi:30S ribosomal protein S8 [Buchnera aphidicola (Mollitrichosiphum nigrofasciatum)]|uniref:30S ribosomal protein S8 n=1 Tax=Buchnera aphidicola TaxID=9 RepID=UPI0031B80722